MGLAQRALFSLSRQESLKSTEGFRNSPSAESFSTIALQSKFDSASTPHGTNIRVLLQALRSVLYLMSIITLACTGSPVGEQSVNRSPSGAPGSAARAGKAEPCRFMGTLHRLSRSRLEVLRIRHRIDKDQWRCAAKELAAIDKTLTAECRIRSVEYSEFRSAQRHSYSKCWGSGHDDEIEDALRIAPGD
jgi:hypothetical protein